MNGAGGLGFYNTAGMPPMQTTQPPPPVYSGTDPTPYATDQPVLVPEQTSVPFWEEPYLDQTPNTQQWYDWQAPLDTEGFTFADTEPQPAWFDWEAPLQFDQPTDYGPTMTAQTAGLPSIPYYQDTAAEQWVIPTSAPGYGPIELVVDILDGAGKVIAKAGEIIWDTGKFILDHLTVGVDYMGDIGGQAKTRKYYEDQGFSAEEAMLMSMYSALQAASRPVPGQTILSQPGQPVIVLPSQAQPATGDAVSTKLILYAAVGVGVLLIASRIFKK